MAYRRYSREKYRKMRRRRRKLQLLYIYFILFVFAVVFCLVLHKIVTSKNNGKKGGAVKYSVAADIGNKPVGYIDYNLMISHKAVVDLPDESGDGDTESNDTTTSVASDMSYEVPDTVLGPVEDVVPANWYDESKYQKVEGPVDLSYFDNVCFIGDSRTEGLVLYSGLPNINGFYYKGLSVDKLSTDRVISIPGVGNGYTCYEAVDATDFDAYYLMFGVNELGWVYTDMFTQNMSDFIDYIKSVKPNAVIYVQSILPVSLSSSQKSDIYTQDRVNMFNEELLNMCKQRGDVIYLDSSAAVIDENGYLPEEASTDGIHCSADYIRRIVQFYRYNTFIKK